MTRKLALCPHVAHSIVADRTTECIITYTLTAKACQSVGVRGIIIAIRLLCVRTAGSCRSGISISLYACNISNSIIAVNKGFVKGFVIIADEPRYKDEFEKILKDKRIEQMIKQ